MAIGKKTKDVKKKIGKYSVSFLKFYQHTFLILLLSTIAALSLSYPVYTAFVNGNFYIIGILATFIFLLIGILISVATLQYFAPDVFSDIRKLAVYLFLLTTLPILVFILGLGSKGILTTLLVIPAGAMTLTGLLGAPSAFILAVFVSTIVGLPSENGAIAIIMSIVAAFIGIIVMDKYWPTREIFKGFIFLFLINFISLYIVNIISGGYVFPHFYYIPLISVAASVGAVGVAVGLTYILARPFKITTKTRLMELSNSSEGLLLQMSNEAPGSYHSSVMVATIAEAGATAIGADALLTRVGALYHDIGKLKRPSFFIENQVPLGLENKHPKLSPRISHLVLTSHVKEGVEIAEEHYLPKEIVDVIRSHHGTTLAAYFYHRALSEANGADVNENDFRYPGPKPYTKEAAIVMLADSVQAAVKSLKEPNRAKIDEMVENIFNNRLYDGQFDECPITLKELTELKNTFEKILTGLYTYTRIEYPETKKEGVNN